MVFVDFYIFFPCVFFAQEINCLPPRAGGADCGGHAETRGAGGLARRCPCPCVRCCAPLLSMEEKFNPMKKLNLVCLKVTNLKKGAGG